jgi:hypothetical protein
MNNKLTIEAIESMIDRSDYLIHSTLTVCVLTMNNGAMVTGESNVIDPANYDEAIGRKMSRRDAVGNIWRLEGYAMKRALHADQG